MLAPITFEVIPNGAALVRVLDWAEPGQGWAALGIWQVDHMYELCRPYCSCGWTTEGAGLWSRGAVDYLEQDRCCGFITIGQPCRCGSKALRRVVGAHVLQHAGVDPQWRFPARGEL